jgi:hypothetical protein
MEQVQDSFYYLDKKLSLPKDGAQTIEELNFDTLFKQTLLRSKLEAILDHIVFDKERFQSLIPKKILQDANPTQKIPQIQNPPREMAARFSPLVLLAQLHDFPKNYN